MFRVSDFSVKMGGIPNKITLGWQVQPTVRQWQLQWSRTLGCAQQEMLKRTPDLYNVQRK